LVEEAVEGDDFFGGGGGGGELGALREAAGLFVGEGAVEDLPDNVKKNKKMVAELIQNNVRKLIIDERPINPKYFDKMSELLDALVEKLRQEAIDYQEYLKEVAELARKIADPNRGGDYPASINSAGKRALYDFLFEDEGLVIEVDKAIRDSAQDGWRAN
jgi:type I restriction enzyme R subunit